MGPSPLAFAAYTAIKVAGYVAFAHGMNKVLGRQVPLLRFGVVKTGLGLCGGLIYLFLVLPEMQSYSHSGLAIYAGFIPFRLLAWTIAASIFYGFRQRPQLITAAIFVGTAYSFLLDFSMELIGQLPGMSMPFC